MIIRSGFQASSGMRGRSRWWEGGEGKSLSCILLQSKEKLIKLSTPMK